MSAVSPAVRTLRREASADSPLAFLIRDERTQRLLSRLAIQLDALRAEAEGGAAAPVLVLQEDEILYARSQWEDAVLLGEQRLHDLATLWAWGLFGTRRLELAARIIASPKREVESRRITIEETLSREELHQMSDQRLAARIARRYRYRSRGRGAAFDKLLARASFLELRPLELGPSAHVTRLMTRVKLDDQIWNKVADLFFDIDELLERDKLLGPLSKYVKDVFGLKLLTMKREAAYAVADDIDRLEFGAEDLELLGIPKADSKVDLIETKDYLALPPEQKKKTGWEALKNVYRWCGQVFEVQIQTEANYFLETHDLSDTSHHTFHMKRDELRSSLDERVPHYKDLRLVLKTLFRSRRRRHKAPQLPPWLELET